MAVMGIWTLILMLPGSLCYFNLHPASKEHSLLVSMQEAVMEQLRISLSMDCTLVSVINGYNDFMKSSQLALLLGRGFSSAHFGIESSNEFNQTEADYDNIMTTIHQIKSNSKCLTLLVASDEESFLKDTIETSVSKEVITWPNRLLVVTSVPIGRLNHLKKIFANTNSAVVVLTGTASLEMHMFNPYSLRKILIGFWTSKFGLKYTSQKRTFPDKFKKLEDGANLSVVEVNCLPHGELHETFLTEDGRLRAKFTGPIIELIEVVAKETNFTYDLFTDEEEAFGTTLVNGSWNGLIGMVIRGEADLALGPFAVTYSRSKVIDYTVTLFVDYLVIQGTRGSTEVPVWGFLVPLQLAVWASILGVLVLVYITAYTLSKFSRDSSFPSSRTFIYNRIILQQDINTKNTKWWERMIVAGLMITTLILVKSYSGNLTSQLSVRYVPEPYQSIRDILNDPSAKMLWAKGTAFVAYIKSAKSGIFYEVAKSEEKGQMVYLPSSEFETAMKTLVSGGHRVSMNPYLTSRSFMTEAYHGKGECKFYISRERYFPYFNSLVAPKNSPLLTAINLRIRSLIEGGLYDYWVQKFLPTAKGCINAPSKITVKSSLSIRNLWGIFMLLLLGYGISLIVLCFELLSAKWRSYLPTTCDIDKQQPMTRYE